MRRDTNFDRARDELFAHVNRCNVMQATEEQQREWMDDTIEYLSERYPELAQEQLEELGAIGMRFCQPVIPHGKEHTALSGSDDSADSESDSMAGVA